MKKQLYHQEEENLKKFRDKVKGKDVYIEDIESFIDGYEDLLNETKVITRISDRLQKKLDKANQKIHSQNVQISKTNSDLKDTIGKLAKATVGKKASTIMFTAAIILFVSEEYYLSPIVEQYVNVPYLSLALKGVIALMLKFIESGLEGYYLKQEKSKIMSRTQSMGKRYQRSAMAGY